MNPDTPYIKFGDLGIGDTYYIVRGFTTNIAEIKQRTVSAISSYKEGEVIFHGDDRPAREVNRVNSRASRVVKKTPYEEFEGEVWTDNLLTSDYRCAIAFVRANIKRILKEKTDKLSEINKEITDLNKKLSEINSL